MFGVVVPPSTPSQEYYGKDDKASEQRIKDLFVELNLEALYLQQEEDSKAQIEQLITTRAEKHGLPTNIFTTMLKTIHLRKK